MNNFLQEKSLIAKICSIKIVVAEDDSLHYNHPANLWKFMKKDSMKRKDPSNKAKFHKNTKINDFLKMENMRYLIRISMTYNNLFVIICLLIRLLKAPLFATKLAKNFHTWTMILWRMKASICYLAKRCLSTSGQHITSASCVTSSNNKAGILSAKFKPTS